jgi:hypothetical protein
MPQANEIFFVVEPGDAETGVPALALVPGAFKEGFQHDDPDCLVEIPPTVGGIALREGMQLTGLAHIFVEHGSQVRPEEELRLLTAEPRQKTVRMTIWD